jgi:hypothetical protein
MLDTRATLTALVVAAAATVFAFGMVTGHFMPRHARAERPCAMPAGVDFTALGPQAKTAAAERLLACNDYEQHRISLADYRAKLAQLDQRFQAPPPPRPPEIVWASHVRSFSSQYGTDSYSAARVIGPPDVSSPGSDNVNAWASQTADGASEFLEVGFDTPRPLRGLDILESYNPGAVTQVELVFLDGTRQVVYTGEPVHGLGATYRRQLQFTCTAEEVVGARITLDSRAVPGWNEIDAIGARPCE